MTDAATIPKDEYRALIAENAKLRNARDMWQENDAKLRELVRDMYEHFHGVVIEGWSYSSDDFRMYEQRMSELGMEVYR